MFMIAVTFISMAFAAGFWFTAGMGLFCKFAKWAPVNITVNVDRRGVHV